MCFDIKKYSWRLIAVLVILSVNVAGSQSSYAQSPPVDQIKLPPGFSIELVARLPSARAMTWGDGGTLFVGSSAGNVYALTFAAPNAGGQASVHTIASGLRDPGGVAFHNGALFVSAVSRVLRFDDIEHRVQSPPEPVVVTDKLPPDGHH